jgi:tellurite resistance protein TehA-like permease
MSTILYGMIVMGFGVAGLFLATYMSLLNIKIIITDIVYGLSTITFLAGVGIFALGGF